MQQPGKSTPRQAMSASGVSGGGDGRSLSSSSRGGSASVSQVETMSSSSSISSVSKSPKPLAQKQERNSNFKVVIRIRPPLPRELSGEIPFQNVVAVDEKEQMITISENIDAVVDEHGQVLANPGPYSAHTLFFDYVYDQNSTQKKVYETTARTVVESALQGYNATIFAYGQTGTGKTYTMEGFNQNGNVENRGIIPRAIEQIFGHIQRHASPRMRFLVRASYLQIYNEQISDLLKPERSNLAIREDKKRGVFVDGLSEWVVRSPAEIYGLMERGGTVRATGETKMNEASSRSHAVFIVIAEQSETIYVDDNGAEMTPEEFQKFVNARGLRKGAATPGPDKLEEHIRQSFKVGKLNLVDLAGSERVRLSGATGQRLEESKQINRSLSALGNVIAALTDSKGRQHIPYRDSKLTRMLEDSLGGNCRTTMMAMISPALEAIVETLSTLKFANRAKNIRNEARVNEDLDQKSLLRKYERELKKLRAELDERNKNVVDMRRLLELDNQRRQAEADKMEAIKALEARSREFMLEKEEKKKLELRISTLMGQMIRGEKPQSGEGNNQNSGPEMQAILKDHQDKFRIEYENKLANLERERETIEEEKAQVDRYKQLLLKQRDIMIALTQRLVERDEQIMALQDELDAYDRHQKDLEEKLDEKTALLIKMQRISMEVNAHSPFKNEELIQVMDSSAATITDNRWGVTKPTSKSGSNSASISSSSNNNNNKNKNNINEPTRNDGATEVVQLADDDDSNVSPSVSSTNLQQLGNKFQHSGGQGVGSGGVENSAIGGNNNNNNNNNNNAAAAVNVQKILTSELELQLRNLEMDSKFKEPIYFIFNQMISKIPSSIGKPNDLDADLSKALYENDRLQQRISDLEQQKSIIGSKAQQQSMTSVETAALQSRCEILVKEREAVQTIMEQKIKVLVQNIAQASQAIITSSSSVNPNFNQALSKDVASLQRLVNASIAALRNAASSNPNAPSSSSASPAAVMSTPQPPSSMASNFNSNSNPTPVSMPQQQYGANFTPQQSYPSSSRLLSNPATNSNSSSSIGRTNSSNGGGYGVVDQRIGVGGSNINSSNNQYFMGGNNGQIQMDSNPRNVLRNPPPAPSGGGLNSYDNLNIRAAGSRG